MDRLLYIAFAIWLVGTTERVFAQISARDYAAIVAAQWRAVDVQIAWRDSKKITIDMDNIPESPKGAVGKYKRS